MSNRNKQSYHHGDLHNQLLETAVAHLRHVGVTKLSLRAIARELGVSQAAPYRHFKDKNALLAALASSGFEVLRREMLTAAEPYEKNAARALQASGIAYIGFARRNPEKYQLMFGQSVIDTRQYPELSNSGKAAFQVLQDIIELGMRQGYFKGQSVELIANTAWALVHGLSTLIIDRLQWVMPEETIKRQIEITTSALIEKI